jgi:hypothetical protein
MEIVKTSDDRKGLCCPAAPLVIERVFFWCGHNRRLAKDFENLVETLDAFVALASTRTQDYRRHPKCAYSWAPLERRSE